MCVCTFVYLLLCLLPIAYDGDDGDGGVKEGKGRKEGRKEGRMEGWKVE